MRWLTAMQLRARDAGTRARAARKLGVPGRASNAADLEPLLTDPEVAVRGAAVEALGAIGGPAVVPLLLRAAKADDVRAEADAAALRESVVEALGAVGTPAVPALLEAVGDRNARVRECAVASLGRIGGEEAAAGLRRALTDDRSALRQLAAAALGRTAGSEAVQDLARALSHRDPATRSAAAHALGDTGAEEAVPALQRAAADHERAVQASALQALAAIGRGPAIHALVQVLAQGDRERRQAAAQALRGAGWAPAGAEQQALHAALHGQFASIGTLAGTAGDWGRAAVELLKTSLADKDASARAAAAAALGRIGDGGAAAPLGALLGDPDPAVREAAERALGALGPASLDALLPALEDRSATRRASARRVLEAAGPGRVAAELIDRLSAGTAVTHGGLALRVVDRLDALDAARHAADSLERLLRLAAPALPGASLQRASALADVVFIEAGQVPAAGERLDLEDLRTLAARALGGGRPAEGEGRR